MPKQRTSGAVLFAKDVARIARFYQEIVPMVVVHTERGLVVLESASFQLVVHGIPAKIAKAVEISSPPARRADVPTKLFFAVTSIANARAKAGALGGGVDSKKKEFEARGVRVCDGYDPEGNVVQFRQSAL